MSVLFVAGIVANCGSNTVPSSLQFVCKFILKIVKFYWYCLQKFVYCADPNCLVFFSFSEFCENLPEDSRETIIMSHILPCVKVKCSISQGFSRLWLVHF